MFLLRWPVVLLLLALIVVCLVGAGVTTAARLDVAQVAAVSAEAQTYGENTTWLQAGLMYAAALMFLIAAVRLMRKTHGFWPWLLGFALFGGAWALSHQLNDWSGMLAQMPRFDEINQDNAGEIAIQAIDQGVLPVVVSLVVGLLILVIDAADGPYQDYDPR